MRSGLLRHRVTLQKPVVTLNDYGESVETWQDVASVNASVSPLSASEQFRASQVQSLVTHSVVIRYRPDVSPRWRALHSGRVLNVENIINKDERNVELTLLCRETLHVS